MENKNLNPELNISCKIWDKEVYELVDYYNTHNKKTKLTINSSGVLSREEKEIFFTPGENQKKSEYELLRIKFNEEAKKYSVNCGTWSKDLNKLIDEDGAYLVYRGISLKDNNNTYNSRYYKLSQGDIVKIGRIYFKILDIHAKKNKEKSIGLKLNGDESTFRGSVNQNSIIINGQQIIRGSLKKNGNNKKIVDHYLSGRAKPMKNSFFKMEEYKGYDGKFSEITVKYNVNQDSNNELFAITKRPRKKEKNEEKKMSNPQIQEKEKDKSNNAKPTKLCRICYEVDSTEENPLIYPCICKGSTKYIHYECLKNWLNSKIEEDISVDSENPEVEVISYNRKDISCELCKEKLPDYIKYNNRFYNISFYKPKFNEFIVFESMRADKHRAKFIHIISFDNKESIHIGRANECELSIAELSVSRFHCIIHKDDGDMFLEDNTSKFGTLVLVQNDNLIVNESLPLYLQINKTFIKIKTPKMEGCSLFCCKEPPMVEQSKLNYQIQNKKGLDILPYFIIKENDDKIAEKEDEEENAGNKIELIDEDNKEQIDENVVIDDEKELIDKDVEENKKIQMSDIKSVNSENKLANSTKIKRISIKKDENDVHKNNLSSIVNIDKNLAKLNENNNGTNKVKNIVKIKNQINNNKAYDKTNANPVTINNPNIYNPDSKDNNKIENQKDE